MDDKDKLLILEFRKRFPPDAERHLKRTIVFGSRARGEAREDSDLDVVVLVDENTPELKKTLDDIAYKIMWDNDFKPIISMKVFPEDRFCSAAKRGFFLQARGRGRDFSVTDEVN